MHEIAELLPEEVVVVCCSGTRLDLFAGTYNVSTVTALVFLVHSEVLREAYDLFCQNSNCI